MCTLQELFYTVPLLEKGETSPPKDLITLTPPATENDLLAQA